MTPPRRPLPDPASIPEARAAPLPGFQPPQLATLARSAPDGDGWLHEIKFDGYRLIAVVEGKTARLHTRSGHDWTDTFPAVARALAGLPVRSAVVDGEAVVLDERGISDFQALQNALDGAGGAVVYFAFDLTYLDGHDLTRVPLIRRKELLKSILGAPGGKHSPGGMQPMVRYSDHIQGHGQAFHHEACLAGLEGTMSKRADSRYEHRRAASWVKAKCSMRQEFVIGGYTAPGGSRAGFGALLLGQYEGGRFVHRGRVGTGFDEKEIMALLREIEPLVQEEQPFHGRLSAQDARGVERWVRPELVAEVEFAGWTEEGLLRHPSFKGLRRDKNPLDVRREDPAGDEGE